MSHSREFTKARSVQYEAVARSPRGLIGMLVNKLEFGKSPEHLSPWERALLEHRRKGHLLLCSRQGSSGTRVGDNAASVAGCPVTRWAGVGWPVSNGR